MFLCAGVYIGSKDIKCVFIIIDGVTCYCGILCTSTPITYNINMFNTSKQAVGESAGVYSDRLRFSITTMKTINLMQNAYFWIIPYRSKIQIIPESVLDPEPLCGVPNRRGFDVKTSGKSQISKAPNFTFKKNSTFAG